MSKYARRKDANHSELQRSMEKMGFAVTDVSMYSGLGCDLLAKRMSDPDGDVWLIEVKNPDMPKSARKLTKAEQGLADKFPERFRILTSADQALEVLK